MKGGEGSKGGDNRLSVMADGGQGYRDTELVNEERTGLFKEKKGVVLLLKLPVIPVMNPGWGGMTSSYSNIQ